MWPRLALHSLGNLSALLLCAEIIGISHNVGSSR